MNVLIISGSPRKGQTENLLYVFQNEINRIGKVDFDYVYLRDMNLLACKGCAVCLEDGEERCPLHDDRDLILHKLKAADGIIFATPNYSLQVTSLMKTFFDRFCFIFHRPCLFGKTCMAFVTQGVYGGGSIIKYVNEVAGFWGANICKGIALTTPWGARNPRTNYPESDMIKINAKIRKGANRFYKALIAPQYPSPSMKRMLFFRLTRSAHKFSKDHKRDYQYFRDNGFLESDYYYKTNIGIHKKLIGSLIDKMIEVQSNK